MADTNRIRSFHERFEIEVGADEARQRFINRIDNSVFIDIPNKAHGTGIIKMRDLYRIVAYLLGIHPDGIPTLKAYVENDFLRCLHVLEVLYQVLGDTQLKDELSELINNAIYASEVDLGIDWQPPIFVQTGARLLDEDLVNEALRWLSDPKYQTVYEPFAKGLSHFLETEKKPQLLADVVTDMYESVEALAKIVTERPNKDLSGNCELFISKVKASNYYKKLLKDYIDYANEFRHAAQAQKPRPALSRAEVESFVYLTGLFIRLAVQRS